MAKKGTLLSHQNYCSFNGYGFGTENSKTTSFCELKLEGKNGLGSLSELLLHYDRSRDLYDKLNI